MKDTTKGIIIFGLFIIFIGIIIFSIVNDHIKEEKFCKDNGYDGLDTMIHSKCYEIDKYRNEVNYRSFTEIDGKYYWL